MRHLNFAENQFGSKLALDVSKSKYKGSLRRLYVQHNRFIGSFPTEIGYLKHLEDLNIARNCFSSNLPNSLENLVHLTQLICTNNSFTGTLPSFRNMTEIKILRLGKYVLFFFPNLVTYLSFLFVKNFMLKTLSSDVLFL